MPDFVHLHVHSCYSLGDGLSKPSDLVAVAKELGFSALALTDRDVCSGLLNFRSACQDAGIKPILGLQIEFVDDLSAEGVSKTTVNFPTTCILLAKNQTGWSNLCQISSKAYESEHFHRNPRIDWSMLEDHHEGLIYLSSGPSSHISWLFMTSGLQYDKPVGVVQRLQGLFGNDVYLGIMRHTARPRPPDPKNPQNTEEDNSWKFNESHEATCAERFLNIGEKTGVKVILTNEVRHAKQEQRESFEVLRAIQSHRTLLNEEVFFWSDDYYLKSAEEMAALVPSLPEVIKNTLEVAAKIEDDIVPQGENFLPEPHIKTGPPDESSFDELKRLVYEGMKAKNIYDIPEYMDRVNYELRVVQACGFVNYFLVLNALIMHAKSQGIRVGAGRGSAAGCCCLYALDVTKLDPIQYGLLFERFFSVDTEYYIDSSLFGLNCPAGSPVTRQEVIAVCREHPECDMTRLRDEGPKIKNTGLLDAFLNTLGGWQTSGSEPGNRNEVNSWIAYYFGMTTAKPSGEFAPGEKLVAARVSPPDVDLDFDYYKQDAIFNYLRDSYGKERFSRIGTTVLFGGRNSVRDVGKALYVGYPEGTRPDQVDNQQLMENLNILADAVPQGKSVAEALELNPQFLQYIKELPKAKRVYKVLCDIDGAVRHYGVHAAGAIICNRPLREVCPLKVTGGEDVVSQFHKDEVEGLGLLKYDCLMVITLTVIEMALELVRERHGVNIDIDNLVPDDEEVFRLLNMGRTKGIFQLESSGITRCLKSVHVDEFNDMIAVNAMYRPGPIEGGVPDLYAAAKHGGGDVVYPHPSTKPVLKETYGLIIYQEQVMQLSRVMAGFSRAQSDKLRKAIGKKKFEILEEMRQKFLDGCIANGISRTVAEDVWAKIEKFGGYGFNKSHAACYAYIAYQTAYLKAHYPIEFMTALLTHEKDTDKLIAYVNECQNALGIDLLKPDINVSLSEDYTIQGEIIRAPFVWLKGVGQSASRAIVEDRQNNGLYKSLKDFVTRMQKRPDKHSVTSSVVKKLIGSNCFVGIAEGKTQEELLEYYESIKNQLAKMSDARKRLGETSITDCLDRLTPRQGYLW